MDSENGNAPDERILRPRNLPEPEPEHQETGITSAVRMREYRKRIKEDDDLYPMHRMLETERLRKFRREMSDEKKEEYRQKSKLRMRRYRERKKRSGEGKGRLKSKTRTGTDMQREKWREQKKQQRERMSQQRKRWINEKRREAYRKRKGRGAGSIGGVSPDRDNNNDDNSSDQENNQHDQSINNTDTEMQFKQYTPSGKARAVARAIAVMPKNPKKFTEVVVGIIKKTSPRKRKIIAQKVGPATKKAKFMTESVTKLKSTLYNLRRKRDTESLRKKRVISTSLGIRHKTEAHYELGLSWKYLIKCSQLPADDGRKRRSDAVNTQTVENIEKFYKRGDISRLLPDKNFVGKKSLQSRHVMERSLKNAFSKFMEENPETNISFSKFVKLRPRNIKTMAHNKLVQCCCEYCINMELKLRAVNKVAVQHKKPDCSIKDKYEASRITLCPKDNAHYRKTCINRKCKLCGVKKLDEKLNSLNDVEGTVMWGKWDNVNKERNGSTVTRKALVNKAGSFTDLVKELKDELSPFSKHLFVAQWQIKQYESLKDKVPDKHCLAVVDFGENYTCTYQEEAQSAHWSYQQATLHPVVCYFPCVYPKCTDIMRHSIVIVSSDLKHDFHAANCFISKAVEVLQSDSVPIEKLIVFSDGAPGQYKNKSAFCDCSFAVKDIGFKMERHYFGSRHGKGPCDAEVGVIKRCASLAVNSRQVIISDATDLAEYCISNLATSGGHNHSQRSFIFVSSDDINRSRPDRVNIVAVKDTRNIHCVLGSSPYKIQTKELSCFCAACTKGRGKCLNISHTGKLTSVNIKKSSVMQGKHK